MEASENGDEENGKGAGAETFRILRHDIKNQLSNIHLAIEQLRYEIPDISEDCTFYLDSIIKSSEVINKRITDLT
jgi:nitrogen-specific signal transduction histidine kinase